MVKWLKKYGWIIIVAIIALIIVPTLIQSLMTDGFSQTSGGTGDGWLGFWGSYLGSIIGIPSSVAIALYTIHSERDQMMVAKYVKYLENISDSAIELQFDIQSLTNYDTETDFGIEFIEFYEKRFGEIVTIRMNSFYQDFNINRFKLPEDRRGFASDSVDDYFAMTNELYKQQIEFSMDVKRKSQAMENYERVSLRNRQTTNEYDDFRDKFKLEIIEINSKLNEASRNLFEISHEAINEMKA